MKKLVAILLLGLPLLASAAEYQQPFGTGPVNYSVSGTQVDHVRFIVPGIQKKIVRIAVFGDKRILSCSTKYCRSKGTQQVILESVVLRGPTSTISFVNGKALALSPGIYVLEITATGIGTGPYTDKGTYSVNLVNVVTTISAPGGD